MKKKVRSFFSFLVVLFSMCFLAACDFNSKNTTTAPKTTTKLDPDNSYTVTYLSEVSNVTMNVFWNEFTEDSFLPVEHPLTSGDRVLKDEPICAEITNNSETDILAIIFIDDSVCDFRKVEAGTTMNPGFYNRQLDGNMLIKVEQYKECNITYSAITNTTIKVSDVEDTFNEKDIPSGGKITKYGSIKIRIDNNSDKRVLAKLTIGSKVLLKTIDKEDQYESNPMYLVDNLTVETLEITGYTVTMNIDSSISTDMDDEEFIWVTVYYEEFDENVVVIDDENLLIPDGMPMYMSVFNSYSTPVTVTITYGTTTKTETIPTNDSGVLTGKVIPTDNVIINITK